MRIVLLDPPEERKKGRWHPLLEWRIRREIRSQGLLEQEEIYPPGEAPAPAFRLL